MRSEPTGLFPPRPFLLKTPPKSKPKWRSYSYQEILEGLQESHPEDTPIITEVITEVITETFDPPSPVLLPPTTITISDSTPALDIVPSTRESTPIIPPSKASSSFDCDLLGVPYSFPSGITVTEKIISRREEPTASLLLNNCMMKGGMEGIMGYSIPSELHDAFSHFQLMATECAHGLFSKWKESKESRVNSKIEKTSLEKRLSEVLREMDEARAQAKERRMKIGPKPKTLRGSTRTFKPFVIGSSNPNMISLVSMRLT
ncbi:hypothetical protein LIER_18342 [Lithospermum erythrorhizon]|uniref:Uncharacterized protein n=1 Tax=Lithospermum erythrorhizon TaxID=34254 RepID=A0AAV3QHR8_LITER